ncbi:maleylpyruvate isomerase family mycothiol-dependent enzyme [Amycolatopsis sp. A133]|uniref:maleylpyruvate isomerase family mycothiol-dependent enzyme n=1 Tax=Amycolatopsis sp. A133 TaxID=3064472 RepID=UPI0027E66FC7|nr:maleylpyruvate isomerase family mycothiol-dependent enzyme [Amycolatopsis sp. A133]MDQ7803114.1 maleylpyruvate isomerase family mycothiol-dependent enzyme [Amycolatopsis sp. A133]
MNQLVDRTIAALRAEHDALAGLVRTLTDEQLAAPSGADEWTVAQALSHLGSGAEIGRAPIARAAGETVAAEDNQTIWARWDASAPRAQAEGFLEHNGRWLETVEALTPEQRSSLTVDLGFLPEPVSLLTALGMRLSEVANHSWDVRVAFDPDAGVDAGSAEVLVDLLAGPVGFMLSFLAKPAELANPVSVAVPGAALVIDDAVTVVNDLESPSATFHGPAEAFVRLVSGRLKAPYDKGVTVEGAVTLDDLRRVFPGF